MTPLLIAGFIVLAVFSSTLIIMACMASAQVNHSQEWYEEPLRLSGPVRHSSPRTIPEP